MPEIEFPIEIDLAKFVSHYAHDLRSPFNRIMGFSRIVLKGQDGPLTDDQKEDLTTVYQDGVYAFNLVSNLVGMARLINGEKALNPMDALLIPLLEQAVTEWKKFHPGQDIQFETNYAEPSPHAHVDKSLFSQGIMALIACVAQYVQPPAEISLAVESETDTLVVTIQSKGQSAKAPSQIDVDMYGYIGFSLLQLHGAKFREQVAFDDGARIQFVLPME